MADAAGKTQVVDLKAKRQLIVLIVAVLMLAAAIIYFDTRLLDHVKQASRQQENMPDQAGSDIGTVPDPGLSIGDGEDSEEGHGNEENGAGGNEGESRLIFSESVTVRYNTPEYDLEIMLCESEDNKTFLRLKYYRDGISFENELDQDQIPELAGIYEKRGDAGRGGSQQEDAAEQGPVSAENRPYAVGQALLNPVHGQLYLMVNGAQLDRYIQSSFYLVDLNDLSVKKLFSYPAKYGSMHFNRDFSKLAYSFSGSPRSGIYPEDSLVEVFDCINAEFLIRGSRKPDNSLIGKNNPAGYIYDYAFEGWHSQNVMKLIQNARPSGNTGAEPVRSEVLYDIERDLILNPDGTEISATGNTGPDNGIREEAVSGETEGSGEMQGNRQDRSEPVEQLKLFYKYLGSDSDYSRAMLMLADGFVLRMKLLVQFGVDEIHKSDIDVNHEEAAMYAGLLKAAKFGDLMEISMPDANTAEISYTHVIGLTGDSQFSQLMKARMEKQGDNWVITLIEDGSQ